MRFSFVRALVRPVPLLTVAASAVTFWVTGLWWLLPMGALAAVIVAALAGTGEAPPAAPPRRDELAGLGMEDRARYRSLLEEKGRVLLELKRRGVDGALELDGTEVESRVEEVARTYRELLSRLEDIKPLLDERGLAAVKKSIEELERQMRATTDEVARENLSVALKNRSDERDRLLELARYRERVEAQLLSLASALTNLRVRLVQGRVSREDSLDPATGIRQSLDGLFQEVEVAEKTSRELNQMVSAGGQDAEGQQAGRRAGLRQLT